MNETIHVRPFTRFDPDRKIKVKKGLVTITGKTRNLIFFYVYKKQKRLS